MLSLWRKWFVVCLFIILAQMTWGELNGRFSPPPSLHYQNQEEPFTPALRRYRAATHCEGLDEALSHLPAAREALYRLPSTPFAAHSHPLQTNICSPLTAVSQEKYGRSSILDLPPPKQPPRFS